MKNILIMLIHEIIFRRWRLNASGSNDRKICQCLSPISYEASAWPTKVKFLRSAVIPDNYITFFSVTFQSDSRFTSPPNIRDLPAESISL